MNPLKIATLLAAGMMVGCMASGPPLTAEEGSAAGPAAVHFDGPLILDPADLKLGTTVHFQRIPTASEINDLSQVRALAHVVLTLADWPTDLNTVSALGQAPEETDVIVILPGYPPSRAASELWNYFGGRIRLVLLAQGPPPSRNVIDDLNAMRHLDRVIAQMDEPSRIGFERLQRPLSFRKVMK